MDLNIDVTFSAGSTFIFEYWVYVAENSAIFYGRLVETMVETSLATR